MRAASTPSTEHLDDFFSALRPRISGFLRTDAMSKALYSTDASLYEIMPLGVLLPRHPDDVQAALEEAHSFNIPILARGGGSSLAGQTVSEALVIDFSRYLDTVIDLNIDERRGNLQPGITLERLDHALRRVAPGLMVGPDPASANRATLGGMLANNSTGTHSILYGNVIRHVREVRALLHDGTPVTFNAQDAEGWRERGRRTGTEGCLYRELSVLLDESSAVIARDTTPHWRRNSGYRLEYLLDD